MSDDQEIFQELKCAIGELKPIYQLGNTQFTSATGASCVLSANDIDDEVKKHTCQFWRKIESSIDSGTKESDNAWCDVAALLLSTLEQERDTRARIYALKQCVIILGHAYGDFLLAKKATDGIGIGKTDTEKIEGWQSYSATIDKLLKLHTEVVGKGYINVTSYYPNKLLSSKPITRKIENPNDDWLLDLSLEHELSQWKEFAQDNINSLNHERTKGRRLSPRRTFINTLLVSIFHFVRKSNKKACEITSTVEEIHTNTLEHFISFLLDESVSKKSISNWKNETIKELENSTDLF